MEKNTLGNHPLDGNAVLIVEDEFLIAFDLQSLIEDAGGDVVGPYGTAATALKAATEEAVSVAVLDVRLGRETTLDVAKTLLDRGIPFIVYTAQAESIGDKFRGGRILSKPADYKIIVQTLSELISV